MNIREAQVSDTVKQRLIAAADQRRQVNQERRLRLKKLAEALRQKQRRLVGLPRIPSRKRPAAPETDTASDVASDTDVPPVDTDVPPVHAVPAKKLKQSNITSFFT